MEKVFYMTHGRERDLIRYADKSDLADAVPCTEEQAKAELVKLGYSEKYAGKFLDGVKKWNRIYGTWTVYKSRPDFH